MKNKGLCFGILFLCISCQQSQVISTIEQAAINAHGGELHKRIKNVSYEKKIWALSQDGDTLSENIEKHYVNFNLNRARMVWFQGGIRWEAKRDLDIVTLQKNDSLISDAIALEKAQRRLNGAQFVFWQPFKFFVDGGNKTYQGTRTLFNGWEVEEVRVNYPNTNDRWSFFFDKINKKLKATGVFHNNKYSLITNDIQETETGLSLHKKRTSYLTDSLFVPIRKGTSYSYIINSIGY